MPKIQVGDIQVYYEIRGTGPRLLFLNGSGGDLRSKPNIFDSPLAAQFEILAHDQRGLGQTERPDIPYTMADYATDADGLLEAIGWDHCNVLGISFGGMVAQEFALSYPRRVDRLVLACTSSGGTGGGSYPLQELDSLSPEDRARIILALSDTRRDAAWQSANPQKFQELVTMTMAGTTMGADEPGRQIGARRQIEARAAHDTYQRLRNLKMPVFICGGRYDGVAPPSNLEAIHSQVPHAHFELFEGGHLFFIQDARAYERIAAFLKDAL